MKSFLSNILYPSPEHDASNSNHIYNLTIFWIVFLTFLIMLFLLIFLDCNLLSGIVTFVLVAGASFAGGAAIGFLFGLPRAEKYRFINKDGVDHNAKEYGYGDNTNLEEVSDWLTKIIVGLTLIKLNTIIGWINSSALSIERVFKSGNCGDDIPLNAYVFGYCTIILYFLAGAGLCYLWARTNLSVILTKSKITQADLQKRTLMSGIQKLTNLHLQPEEGISTTVPNPTLAAAVRANYPTENFRNLIQSIYNAKPVYNKADLQKGRWGSESKKGDYIFEATYIPETNISGMYKMKLSVRCLRMENAGVTEIAFFLHDTFASQIVYTVINNNIAELTLSAYEAFVAGARVEDNTELELDLNKVQGFPDGFYWKE